VTRAGLLLRNEYLAGENRILRAHLPSRLPLSDAERSTLAKIAKRQGRKAVKDIARVAKPDTLLGWYRRLVTQKFDASRYRAYPGRPRVSAAVVGTRRVSLGASPGIHVTQRWRAQGT
jgi:putative transposase